MCVFVCVYQPYVHSFVTGCRDQWRVDVLSNVTIYDLITI